MLVRGEAYQPELYVAAPLRSALEAGPLKPPDDFGAGHRTHRAISRVRINGDGTSVAGWSSK